MKTAHLIFILFTFCIISCTNNKPQIRVNFTGTAPAQYLNDKQPLTVFTCGGGAYQHHMGWTGDNPIELPYGWQGNGDGRYFISQYYIASPPLPNQFVAKTPLILGVLSQDHFTVDDPTATVEVFMDYRLLEPIKLGFMPVDYTGGVNTLAQGAASCLDLGVNQIPINIRCPEFTYTAYGRSVTGRETGLGKGIGLLSRKTDKAGLMLDEGQLFIPLDPNTDVPLDQCSVELVNDVLPDHQVYFDTDRGLEQTLDLSAAYQAFKHSGQQVGLYCRMRPADQPAAGCQPPKP